jgi:membrane protease YdiL (CAAX protease family)
MPMPAVDPDIVVECTELAAAILVTFVVLRWHTETAQWLSFKFDLKFLPFACILGLLGGNVCFAIQKELGEVGFYKLGLFTLALGVLAVPVIEETLCRGVILESLLHRHRIPFSIFLSSILFAFDHASFWPALVGQIMLSTVYLGSRRSLTMSMIAHGVSNLATSFPFDVLRYTHYFKS